MSRVKDLYIDLLEEKMADMIDKGVDPDKAYDIAGDRAYKDLGDHMADMADRARLRQKEGR